MGITEALVGGVDKHLMSRLCVHDTHQSYIGKFLGAPVIDLYCPYVMLMIADGKSILKVGFVVEVAEDESSTTASHHLGKELYRHTEVGLKALRLEVEHLTDDEKDMLAAFLRRDVLLNTVREEYNPYFVVVLNG